MKFLNFQNSKILKLFNLFNLCSRFKFENLQTFFILQIVASLLALAVSSSSGSSCPSGFYRILDSCIKLSRDKQNFDSAQQKCAQLVPNGRLFEPKNRLQNELVKTLVKIQQPSNAWIGITLNRSKGRFEYSSSGKDASFQDWAPGNPNQTGDCVIFWFQWPNDGGNVDDSRRGKWNDENCPKKMNYICEQPF